MIEQDDRYYWLVQGVSSSELVKSLDTILKSAKGESLKGWTCHDEVFDFAPKADLDWAGLAGTLLRSPLTVEASMESHWRELADESILY
jgi:hypothetical protein